MTGLKEQEPRGGKTGVKTGAKTAAKPGAEPGVKAGAEKRPYVREILVVEGRDDTCAVKRALDAETIETHGFGMPDDMWRRLETAAKTRGLIVLTDPDHAGGEIRRKILERFPDAKQAFLPREEARKNGDIGVENARPEAIREAVARVCDPGRKSGDVFTMRDLEEAGLVGRPDAGIRRRRVTEALGIGRCNAKTALARLNAFGVTKEAFHEALRSGRDPISEKKI